MSSINAQKQALEKSGHTVYIFSTAYPKSKQELEKLAKDCIFVVPSCRLFFKNLTPVSRRPKIIENWLIKNHPEIKQFDIFYVHYESGCSIAGLRLAKKLKIPSVQVMHGREDMGESMLIPHGFRTIVAVLLNWFHSWYLPHKIKIKKDNYLATTTAKAKMWTLMVNHANNADLILTPSAHFRQKLLHYHVTKPIKVFPNGFPDDKFPQNVSPKELKPQETMRLIWHSRVSGEKRIMPFLKALNICHQQNHSFIMDVYGNGPDFNKATSYAKKHHLPVKFHGNVKYAVVQSAIEKSHLDILVSYNYDTFGMTLIEAEASGVPAFICDKDMQEIIPNSSFVLSKSETPEDMAAALQELFTHPEIIRQMSEVMLKHRDEVLISKRIKLLEKYFRSV